jgi:hypothetical protein
MLALVILSARLVNIKKTTIKYRNKQIKITDGYINKDL